MRARSSTRSRWNDESLLRWVNFVLAKRNRSAKSIELDFRDGALLAELVSELSRKPPVKLKRGKALQRWDCLSNLTVVFNFLKDEGLTRLLIAPNDVYDGNVKLTCALLFSLLTFYFLGHEEDTDAVQAGVMSLAKALGPKQKLLEWTKCIVNSYPGVNVQAWNSFSDGLALCALIHFHCPSLLDFYTLDASKAEDNVRKAFQVLEQGWGIPKFVDVNDLISHRADEELLVALLATCKKELQNPPRGADATVGDSLGTLSESRALLYALLEASAQGDRKAVDERMVDVLKLFRALAVRVDEAQTSFAGDQLKRLNRWRAQMDRALGELSIDVVRYCQHPNSALLKRLSRRDVTTLCFAEHEIEAVLAEASQMAIAQQLRVIKKQSEPHMLQAKEQASKTLENELNDLTDAAKIKLQERLPHLESDQAQAARRMVAELEALSQQAGSTGVAPAELNRELASLMADLELTLSVAASSVVKLLIGAIDSGLPRVRQVGQEDRVAVVSEVTERCQAAVAASRRACHDETMPKNVARSVLASVDLVDEALMALLKVPANDAKQVEQALHVLRDRCVDLLQRVQDAEDSNESALPEVRDAVTGVLVAIRNIDKNGIEKSSLALDHGTLRAFDIADQKKPKALNAALVEDFQRDLQILRPLHREAAKRCVAMPVPDSGALRKVAETARDLLSVVQDLEEASRPVAAENESEFASLQALLVGHELDTFDLVNEARDVAFSAREAFADAAPDDFEALAALAQAHEIELTGAIAALGEFDAENIAPPENVVVAVPKLEKAVKKKKKQKAKERREEAPNDDLARLGRYVRAGVERDRVAELQQDVQKKSKNHIRKKRDEAQRETDPIRQQRILKAADELEQAMPLQFEAFAAYASSGADPDELLSELDALSFGVSELDSLFPDLQITSVIDLDSAILSLQESSHDVNSEPAAAAALRPIDKKVLKSRKPKGLRNDMMAMDALELPALHANNSNNDALSLISELEAFAPTKQTPASPFDGVSHVVEELQGRKVRLEHHVQQDDKRGSQSSSSSSDFQRDFKASVNDVVRMCGDAGTPSFDAAAFGKALVRVCDVFEEHAARISDATERAKVLRLVSTMMETGARALSSAAEMSSTPSSPRPPEMIAQEFQGVKLVASRAEALVSKFSSGSSKKSDVTTLEIGKAVTLAIAELSKGKPGSFSNYFAVPNGNKGCHDVLADASTRVTRELSDKGPSVPLREAAVFFLNVVKQLCASYARGDAQKLGRVVALCKDWAGRLIIAMKSFEDSGNCSSTEVGEAAVQIVSFVQTEVVLRCIRCKELISGSYVTMDDKAYHNECVPK